MHKVFISFSTFCAREIRSINIAQRVSDEVLRSVLADSPDIVVSTPGRASQNLNSSHFSLDKLLHLVIDEADLILSYGYRDDLELISKALPRGLQTFLMSATLTPEIDTIKGFFCANPVTLKLDDEELEGPEISQYVVRCAEEDKFLLTYVIFKLQLITGKSIVFVSDVDRSYQVKLFLDQFGVKSCVLNSELPVNSRIHVVQEFNKGTYDTIIAADDQEVLGGIVSKRREAQSGRSTIPEHDQLDEFEQDARHSKHSKRKRPAKLKDYGISRGIDFQDVAFILNFDLPTSAKSYTHRIGRTGRAGKNGMALSFVIPADQYHRHKLTSTPSTKHDEKVLAKIVSRQEKKGREVKPYHFDMHEVDAFRYRMNDALKAISSNAVHQARSRELKEELLKSERLKRHFEENPSDLRHLRHDGTIKTLRVQPHLRHIPEYLIPTKGRKPYPAGGAGLHEANNTKEKGTDGTAKRKSIPARKVRRGQAGIKSIDPLKSFGTKTVR